MRVILLCLLLSGCATQPQVVHVTWVKDAGVTPYVVRVTADTCLIVTGNETVEFTVFGSLFKQCLGEK